MATPASVIDITTGRQLYMEPFTMHCPTPGCAYRASSQREGMAIRRLTVHVAREHRARITTNETIMPDLHASLRTRGVAAGHTWGTFKAAMQSLGISDSTPLLSIEYGISQTGTSLIGAEGDPEHGYEVREVSITQARGPYGRVVATRVDSNGNDMSGEGA